MDSEKKYWRVSSEEYSLDGARKVIFDNSVREVKIEDPFENKKYIIDYDLYLYKIQDREAFYQRDHPVNVNPKSYTYQNYWGAFGKKCIEGAWIKDNDVWVYMPSKLFYFINYVVITGNEEGDESNRTRIKPDLSSLEWIQASYVMIVDGFSGFENDDQYTCNDLVLKLHDGISLGKYEQKKLKNCYAPNGDLKIYVDPWEYLTRFYHYDNPRGESLGNALWDNSLSNALVSGARGVAKSIYAYMADLMHTWTFGIVKRWEKRNQVNDKVLLAAGSANKSAINRSLKMIKDFYDSQPGKYKYNGSERPDHMGPFYKNVQGNWSTGNEVDHIVKEKNKTDFIAGSNLQINALTKDAKRIGSGDRKLRQYIEEAGLIEYLGEIHATNKDALSVGETIVGSAYYSGTAGDMEAIEALKKMILNPKGYQMASIPNYWKANDSRITLFLSAIYKYRNFKDENGNNDLLESLQYIAKERVKDFNNMDSQQFDETILNNPIDPDEMLRPNRRSFLPAGRAQKRLADIEDYKYDIINTTVGDLVWNPSEQYAVEFIKDMRGLLTPINDYNIDRQKVDISGAYQIYEHPPEYIPENLFWVVYDPVSKPGRGESLDASLNTALVYKSFYTGNENTLEDSIVADWVGRLDDLEDTYEKVIKLAKYYNAKIFPETNTPGFVDYCKRNNYEHMLQSEAYHAEKEINPNFRKRRGVYGFSVYGEKKVWLLQWLKSWLLKKRNVDPDTGEFDSINTDHLFPKRLLNEIINFDETKGNYDYISAMLGLMLLIVDIRENAPVKMYRDDEVIDPYRDMLTQVPNKRVRSTFEELMY